MPGDLRGAYEGLRSNVRELHPEIDRWMVEDGYGKVLARSGLPVTTRELCIVAILAVQGFPIQLYSHLRGALRVGCPPAWVESTLARSLRSADPDHRRRMLAVWRELASGPGPEPGAVASAPGADINPEPVERDHVR